MCGWDERNMCVQISVENKEKWVKEIIKSLSSSDWLKFSKENDSLGQLKQQAMIEYLSEEKNTLALISRAEKL